ncbi:hypothetical protein BJX63DRAFT_57547 [Aspergillus granulosus]|uniref:Zn(2)-C6 fungal-type domain-containing protein n=1 Tax=Aspergillus granulosus TaxID=176169 RepID=A0ABR4GXC2_9EURO
METRKTRAGAKACRSCRRRKVRCQFDSGMTKCRACYRRSSLCIPSALEKVTRESATPPQLEHDPTAFDHPFIDVFGGLPTPDFLPHPQLAQDAHHNISLPPLPHHLDSLFPPAAADADPFSTLLCFSLPRSLVSYQTSSPFSIFSPEGNDWLHRAVGSEGFNSDLLSSPVFASDASFGNSVGGPPSRLAHQFTPLPLKDVARSLLRTYFERCNPFCPTFEEHEFMLWFELEYPIGPESSAAWACLNATLALACLLDRDSYSKAWLFWKNATLSWESFITHAPSLSSAQALLTMTLYLLGTFHSNPSSAMIPMAIRMLSGISPALDGKSQQFQFVHIASQALDIDHALQAGVPPTQLGAVEYSWDSAIPKANEDPNAPFDCFPAFCRLLELKEEVYRQLYSVSAQRKNDYEAISAVGDLDFQLEQWKSDIPEKYRPGHPTSGDAIKQGISDTVLHLHLSYYNSVLVIHRRSLSYQTFSKRSCSAQTTAPSVQSANPRALASTHLCAEAARASLRLVKYIPKDNPLTRGVMLHYVVFALKLLVTLTVRDPYCPRARADILLMRNFEDELSVIPAAQEERATRNLIEYCTHFRHVAERAINDVLSRQRPQGLDEPVEEHTSYNERQGLNSPIRQGIFSERIVGPQDSQR